MIEEATVSVGLKQSAAVFIENYLSRSQSSDVTNLHDMFLEQIEIPLFDAVMQHARYNQVKAAKLLGISRGTLRKKLIAYFGDKYCGNRSND